MRKLNEQRDDAAANIRFEALFLEHHAAVLAYVRRRAPADIVDDVVGETFLVAWRRLDRVPEQGLPWLLAVARNVLATQRRGLRRREALVARLRGAADPQWAPSPAEGADGRVLEALRRLGEKEREALTLIAWEGLSPQQAAVVLGESPGTFRVRLHRARQRLRWLLEDDQEAARPRVATKPIIGEPIHD